MPENNDQKFEEKLKRVVETIDVANVLTNPLTDSIKNLLEISSASMNSEEASVIIRDGDDGDLKFLCAIGQVADQLIGLEIPAGKGIAGFVFSSGQPMTISDVGQEQTFYAEVDKKTGFSTQTILATPLQYEGNIIGVLEYVNRIGEPPFEPFTPEEMDKAVWYAEAIASLVNAYESVKLFKELGDQMLSSDSHLSVTEIRSWILNLRDANDHKEMIDLAVLVRELALRGEVERKLCKEILESILNYSDNNTDIKYSSL
jgi:signal transduction protein with GAF and PtsI domain